MPTKLKDTIEKVYKLSNKNSNRKRRKIRTSNNSKGLIEILQIMILQLNGY